MKLGVIKFKDLIDFPKGFHQIYFISTRAWVENLQNFIKSLMVVMQSYFYKGNKYKTFVKKAILVTS